MRGRLERFFRAPAAGTIEATDDFLMTHGIDNPFTRSWGEPVRLGGKELDAVRALGARSGPMAVVLCPSLAVTPALRAAQAALRLHRLAQAADVFVSAHVQLAGARTSEAAAPARERLASAESTLVYLAKRYPPRPDAYMRSALERWRQAPPPISVDAMQRAAMDVFDLIGHKGLLWVAAARFVLELFDKMDTPLAEDAASELYVLVNVFLFAFAGLETAETDDTGLLALNELDLATIDLGRFARRYRGMVD